jgi:hypothetical protein
MANWECLKTFEKLNLRKYIDSFEEKLLQQTRGNKSRQTSRQTKRKRWDTFTDFANKNIKNLTHWKFEKAEDFITVLKHLYQNVLNDAAHPTFVITNDIVIPRSMLYDNQFRAMGVIWKRNHPIEKLRIGYEHKPSESVTVLKKSDQDEL